MCCVEVCRDALFSGMLRFVVLLCAVLCCVMMFCVVLLCGAM